MSLIFYELKKVISKKGFIIAFLLCFVLNIFLLYYFQNSNEDNYKLIYANEYNELIDEYSKYPPDKAKKMIDDRLLAYEIKGILESISTADNEDRINSLTEQLENYKLNNASAYEQAKKLIAENNENLYEIQFLYDISQQIDYINSYPEFIDEMYSRAEQQSSSSIFSDENEFSYKNLFKTANDYEHLKGLNLSIVNSSAITETTNYNISDFFVIATILVICVYLFNVEREEGLYKLIRATKNGRLKTIISKTVVLFLLSALISIIFVVSNFVVDFALYGYSDLSINIQSISEFRNCIFNLTQWQFILTFIFAKVLAVLVISSIFIIIFTCFSSTSLMYILNISVIAIEYILYLFIKPDTFLANLKYINIFYIFDAQNSVGSYLNLDIFSNPVNSLYIAIIIFAVISLICIFVSCWIFCTQNQEKGRSKIASIVENFKQKFFKIKGSTSIFKGEMFKYLVQNKMIFAVILIVGFGVMSSIGTVRYSYEKESDIFYKTYMEHLEGDITKEKELYIDEQRKYFDSLENNAIEDNGIISQYADSTIATKGEAFQRVEHQYKRLLELKKDGINARFIDENIYGNFLSNPTREWNNSILVCLMAIITMSCIFTMEYKNMAITLIGSTKNGKGTLFINKILIALLSLILSFTAVYLPYFIRFINTYGTDSFETQTICLQENGTLFSIIGTLSINVMCYFLLSVLIMAVVIILSVSLKNNLTVMVITSIILMIPCLALQSFENIRFGYIIQNNCLLCICVICPIIIIMTICLIIVSFNLFTEDKVRRKANVKVRN